MGLFALAIVVMTMFGLMVRFFHRRRIELRDPETRRIVDRDTDQRMGHGLGGLNEKLPFLGGQGGFDLGPVPEDDITDEQDPHRMTVEAPEYPDV
ncbi:MAG: hypothetical protein GY913_27410 [Proteobacteria bacterium]|nr:hypothetical protein [Pseudomonadota bacterium]MCP4920644.1 hypothetical protein [Pseudomonadota bacterium]